MSISANEALRRIKVTVEAQSPKTAGKRLYWWRRAVQAAMILVFILIPLTGLFRIDPAAGSFVVLGRQVWFSDFSIVMGFWVAVASALILMYSTVGMAFCGWACPQNTLSEWANRMTHKFLGKRAEVSLDGEPLHVSPGKRKWTNWLILGALFLGVSMAAALIPLLYFYAPGAIWSFITFQEDARLANSLHWIYTIFVVIILVDIAVVRYFFCRFMCIYRVWQHSFKTKQTLHIAYDAARADAAGCATCNYCVKVCPVEIDPRNTSLYDSCINCGACVTACDSLQQKSNAASLLRFEFGARVAAARTGLRSGLISLFGRAGWTLPVTLAGAALFAWGIWNYEPYHFSVYRAETLQGATIQDYRINVANKLYQDVTLKIDVRGLPAGSYDLASDQAAFTGAGRQDINLHIRPGLAPGLHSFTVDIAAADGWRKSYRVQHFVPRGKA
ncbi:MAG: 4Fe-4S dicluster domain-containing protein [Pseudomonadota bacterium]